MGLIVYFEKDTLPTVHISEHSGIFFDYGFFSTNIFDICMLVKLIASQLSQEAFFNVIESGDLPDDLSDAMMEYVGMDKFY